MTHCLYRHFAADGELLYVGISLCAVNRLGQHKEHSTWFDRIARVDIERLETREAALAAERLAIVEERPVYNVLHHPARIVRRSPERKTGNPWPINEFARGFRIAGTSGPIYVSKPSGDPRMNRTIRTVLRRHGVPEEVQQRWSIA